MSTQLTGEQPTTTAAIAASRDAVMLTVLRHSLAWMVLSNAIGVMIAVLLLAPGLGNLLQPWSYGRWMPVHLNLQLYGWCSLPLVAFLLRVYRVEESPATAAWSRSVLWLWSLALAVGSLTWLNGHTSGKLFLDWTGVSRVLFPLALAALWLLLAAGLRHAITSGALPQWHARIGRGLGLLALLPIPWMLYFASNPAIYPPINPDTGGPTGASQLESTLVIIAILLVLPYGLTQRSSEGRTALRAAWWIFAAESLLCLGLGRADISHHRPTQWISLGSLLVWIPLLPAHYRAFQWHRATQLWRRSFLVWWAVLVPTGWLLFLPGVLDRFKFTDGLVGHSLLAMAGFVTSLLIFALVQLMPNGGWIFEARWSFWMWQLCTAIYIAIMFYAGWQESENVAFTIITSPLRNAIYALRLAVGLGMLIASADWLVRALLHDDRYNLAPEAA